MPFEVRLLGPWELRSSAGEVAVPPGRLRILLTSLALSANETVGVGTLAEQLWPEQPPARARDTVHLYIVRLRKLLGSGVIRTDPRSGYRLGIARDDIDVHRFRDLLRQARRTGSKHEELALLRSALELWRGTPFADLYSTWLDRDEVPRLTEEWFAATCRRIALDLATGPPEPLIAELRELVAEYRLHESLWHQLITALYRAGRRGEALSAYQQVRTTLRDELGIEPGAALARLQREILLGGSAAWSEPVSARTSRRTTVPRQLPHDITRFTGRAEELTALDGLLADARPSTPTIVSIDGPAGVGKTTLAVHWAHRVADRYPDAQLYFNLRGYGPGRPLSPHLAAEMLLRSLGVDSGRLPSDLDGLAALLRSTLSDRSTLILLDNARDTDQVRPLLPGRAGLVLVTSRDQLRGLSIRDGARRVTLSPLPPQQSAELLAATLGDAWVAREPTAVTDLIELCDRLPLALAIVAEQALRAGSLAQVVAQLADERARLDNLDTDDCSTSLRAALSWSYRALTPDAAAMFRDLGLHPARDIEVRTAAALADVPVTQAQATLDQLLAAHLVEQRRANRYELHDLTRLYATELTKHADATDREAAVRRVLNWYLHAAASADRRLHPHRNHEFLAQYEPATPPPTFTTPAAAKAWFEQEYDSLRSVACWAANNGFGGHAWRISMTMTTYFDHAIPWRDGLEFYQRAFRAAQTAGEPVGEAYTLNSLACIHLDMNDWDTARSHLERSNTRFRALAHTFGQAMTLGNLALAHGGLGDGDMAREYATQALDLFTQLGQPRGIAQNLDNLGTAHMLAGEYDQAVDCFHKALTIHHSDDRELETWNRLHLAQAYSALRDFPNATRAFRQAHALHSTYGNRRWQAIVLNDFGTMLTDAGHPTIGRAMRQNALATLAEFA